MSNADKIRSHGRERYVLPARRREQKRFSIRAGDVVHELNINGRAPAVCSALKSREFLKQNDLLLVESSGPKSGQSTTVTYTYEFVDPQKLSLEKGDAWIRMRGALKNVFAKLDGGEAYLRSERKEFRDTNVRSPRDSK
ncbi:MAG: hypothetical protein M3O09_13050 [Acidobacteriota bacterium]|jgi:hypothetical protein|nr:hypothetical protein [Acidobacteriota bacterium]